MADDIQYDNLDIDIANLSVFVNDPAGDVTPRIGAVYPNVRKIIENLAEIDVGESAAALINERIDGISSDLGISIGAMANTATVREVFNGATATSTGFAIPNAQTGADTYTIQLAAVPADLAAMLAGASVDVITVSPSSDDFITHHALTGLTSRAILANAAVVDAGTIIDAGTNFGSSFRRIVRRTFTGDERSIGNIVQITGAYNTGARFVDSAETTLRVVALPEDSPLSLNDQNLTLRLRAFGVEIAADIATAQDEIIAGVSDNLVLIDPTGSGGAPTSPGGVDQGALGARPSAPFVLMHKLATYALVGLPTFDDVALVSQLGRDFTTFRTALPNNTALATITASSVIDAASRTRISGLTLEIFNGRYVLHSDNGGLNENKTLTIENCRLVHRDNKSAYDYQVSLGGGGNPAGVWTTTCAVGAGTASGSVLNLINTIMVGPVGGFLAHNSPFNDPEKGAIINHIGGAAAAYNIHQPSHNYQSLGDGRMSYVSIVGQSLTGNVEHKTNATVWFPATGVGHPADHREHEVFGHSNTPEVWWSRDYGQALRLTSPTSTGASSVVISGTFADAFAVAGHAIKQVGCGAGLAAYAWLPADVSGVVAGKSLGGLMGNCTSVNKILTITVDGGSPVNYVFDADYSAMNNATALAAIVAKLAGAAVPSLFQPGNEYYAHFSDEERILVNSSAVDIERGDIVAFNSDDRCVRLMTNADAAWLRAGVALERICAGQFGRIKERGKMALANMARSDAGTPAFGATMGIGATPGKIAVAHGGADLFRVIRAAGSNDANDAVIFV